MTRWNEAVTLLSPAEKYQDMSGTWHRGEPEERTVFCNEMTIGSMTMAHLRSQDIRTENSTERVDTGFHHERMLQLRSMDYRDEQQVIYHGAEYEVMYTSGAGELVTITIGQRLSSLGVPNG